MLLTGEGTVVTVRKLLAFSCLAKFVNAQSAISMLSQSQVSATSFSYISGPVLDGWTWMWTKASTPVTVGTVTVAVDEASNQVGRSTTFHSNFLNYANASLFSPTATNAAGTKTEYAYDGIYLTYPTNYFVPSSSLTYVAVVPITSTGEYAQLPSRPELVANSFTITDLGLEGTCCFTTTILQPTPAHEPFIQDHAAFDINDPDGLMYSVYSTDGWAAYTRLDPYQLSSLWSSMSLNISYTGCPHPLCSFTSIVITHDDDGDTPNIAPSAVNTVASILATTTMTLDSDTASLKMMLPAMSPVPESIVAPTMADSTPTVFSSTSVASSVTTVDGPARLPSSSASLSTAVLIFEPANEQSKGSSTILASYPKSFGELQSTVYEASAASRTRLFSQITLPAVPPLTKTDTISGITLVEVATPIYILSGHTVEPGVPATIGSGSDMAVVSLVTKGSDIVLNLELQQMSATEVNSIPTNLSASAIVSTDVWSRPSTTGTISSASGLGALTTQGLASVISAVGSSTAELSAAAVDNATTAVSRKSSAPIPPSADCSILGIWIALGATIAELVCPALLLG